MRWVDVIELIGLILLALLAVVLLLPLIVLSIQVVAVTGLLFAAGLFYSWLSGEAAHIYAWLAEHHRMTHRVTARRV
jgi:uncharacterized membrane protein YdjX (TVP38/TMEM64 family)